MRINLTTDDGEVIEVFRELTAEDFRGAGAQALIAELREAVYRHDGTPTASSMTQRSGA